jgi:hypothetical protein
MLFVVRVEVVLDALPVLEPLDTVVFPLFEDLLEDVLAGPL